MTTGKVLILSWAGGGNVGPAHNLGERLVANGHRVRVIGWQEQAAAAAEAGLDFAAYPSMSPVPVGVSYDELGEEWLIPVLCGEDIRDDALAAAADFDPDVVVVDCMLRAGIDAAERIDCPAAALLHVLYSRFMHDWPADDAAREARAQTFGRFAAVLALTPPGLEADRLAPNATHVGPILSPRPPAALRPDDAALLASPGDPWVLLSLSSTLQGQATALPPMIEALASLPVRVLLTLGEVDLGGEVPEAPNLTVRGFIPHPSLLPHMSAVVSHGGLSTITASLAAGVPLVCIPQGRDQHDNAEVVAASGVGLSVPTDAAPTAIAEAVRRVLAEASFRDVATEFAATIDDLGRGAVAADLVASVLDDGRDEA